MESLLRNVVYKIRQGILSLLSRTFIYSRF
jgi:hypothetical protein